MGVPSRPRPRPRPLPRPAPPSAPPPPAAAPLGLTVPHLLHLPVQCAHTCVGTHGCHGQAQELGERAELRARTLPGGTSHGAGQWRAPRKLKLMLPQPGHGQSPSRISFGGAMPPRTCSATARLTTPAARFVPGKCGLQDVLSVSKRLQTYHSAGRWAAKVALHCLGLRFFCHWRWLVATILLRLLLRRLLLLLRWRRRAGQLHRVVWLGILQRRRSRGRPATMAKTARWAGIRGEPAGTAAEIAATTTTAPSAAASVKAAAAAKATAAAAPPARQLILRRLLVRKRDGQRRACIHV